MVATSQAIFGPYTAIAGLDRDAAAQLAGQQPGRLISLPLRVREPVPHVVRPVPQLAVAARPYRHPLVPVLGVDGEHACRADHQVVDLLLLSGMARQCMAR